MENSWIGKQLSIEDRGMFNRLIHSGPYEGYKILFDYKTRDRIEDRILKRDSIAVDIPAIRVLIMLKQPVAVLVMLGLIDHRDEERCRKKAKKLKLHADMRLRDMSSSDKRRYFKDCNDGWA
jgi:hypothetical protein